MTRKERHIFDADGLTVNMGMKIDWQSGSVPKCILVWEWRGSCNWTDRIEWGVVSVDDRPCHHPLQVDPGVQQAQADQRDPGHHHDQLDLEALSHPRGKDICSNHILKTKISRTEGQRKRNKERND